MIFVYIGDHFQAFDTLLVILLWMSWSWPLIFLVILFALRLSMSDRETLHVFGFIFPVQQYCGRFTKSRGSNSMSQMAAYSMSFPTNPMYSSTKESSKESLWLDSEFESLSQFSELFYS